MKKTIQFFEVVLATAIFAVLGNFMDIPWNVLGALIVLCYFIMTDKVDMVRKTTELEKKISDLEKEIRDMQKQIYN